MKHLAALFLTLFASSVFAASFDSTVTWIDNSSNETGFKVYRKTGAGGTYAQVGQVAANITTFTDIGLAQDTNYCYKVGAFNSVDEKQGPEMCGTTGGAVQAGPSAPTIIYIYKP